MTEPNKMKEFQKELAGMIKEQLSESFGHDELKAKFAEQEEAAAKALEANKALAEKVEKMEKAQGKVLDLEVPGSEKKTDSFIYKGYNLNGQGLSLNMKDNDKRERYAKFFIDAIRGKASLTEGNTGAYVLEDEMVHDVMGLARLSSVALQECRILNTGNDTVKIPVEATSTSVDAQAFGTANTESDATLGQISLDMNRIGNYCEVYNDLLADSFFDITSWLMDLNAETYGQAIDAGVFNGSNSFTQGLLGNCGTTVTVSGSNGTIADLAFGDFSEAISSLAGVRKAGAKFYLNKTGMHYVRTMIDASNRLIYQFPSDGAPSGIYGYPVVEVESITGAPASSAYFVIYGNLKNYVLGIRQGMEMTVNPYIKMKEGISQFIFFGRADGAILLSNGLVDFQLA